MPRTRPLFTPTISTNEIASVTDIVEHLTDRAPSWERTPRGRECEDGLRAEYDALAAAESAEYDSIGEAPAPRPDAMPWDSQKPPLSAAALASGHVRPKVTQRRIEAAGGYLSAVEAWAENVRMLCQGAEGRPETPSARKRVLALWDAWEGAGHTTAGHVDTFQALVRIAFDATAGSLRGRRMLADCLTGMGCEERAALKLCGIDSDWIGLAQREARGLALVVSEQVALIPTNGQGVRDVCADMADLVDMVAPWVPAKSGKGE